MSRPFETPQGPDIFDSLTTSLIHPNTMQFHQLPQPSWQGPSQWQQSGEMVDDDYSGRDGFGTPRPNTRYVEPNLVLYGEASGRSYADEMQQFRMSSVGDQREMVDIVANVRFSPSSLLSEPQLS